MNRCFIFHRWEYLRLTRALTMRQVRGKRKCKDCGCTQITKDFYSGYKKWHETIM